MDPKLDSPPTSADSSRSGSPDTRATTPSSSTERVQHTYLPLSFVRISGMMISCEAIQTLFKRHAISNRIGLIVENESVNGTSFVEEQWGTQELQLPAVSYMVSSSYSLPDHLAVGYSWVSSIVDANQILGLLINGFYPSSPSLLILSRVFTSDSFCFDRYRGDSAHS